MRDNPNDSVKNILGPEIENASRLEMANEGDEFEDCLLYTSPSPRD